MYNDRYLYTHTKMNVKYIRPFFNNIMHLYIPSWPRGETRVETSSQGVKNIMYYETDTLSIQSFFFISPLRKLIYITEFYIHRYVN